MTRCFKLTVAYDGADFVGWQIQPNGVSIQSTIQDAIAKFTGENVKVIGSGRTDSGVHAIAQVAGCQLETWNRSASDLRRAINRFLPDSVVVRDAVEVPSDFHPIYSATGKRYRYQLLLGRIRDPFAAPYCWHLGYPMDLDAMRRAAQYLLGNQDFACFQAAGSDRQTTVRDLRACDVILRTSETSDSQRVDIEVEADGFLYNMVRNIVGTLVDVARGRRKPEWVGELIAAADRRLAAQTAPAHGLFLLRVDYDPETLQR